MLLIKHHVALLGDKAGLVVTVLDARVFFRGHQRDLGVGKLRDLLEDTVLLLQLVLKMLCLFLQLAVLVIDLLDLDGESLLLVLQLALEVSLKLASKQLDLVLMLDFNIVDLLIKSLFFLHQIF